MTTLLHRRSNRLCGARLSAKQAALRGHPYCRAVVPTGLKRCGFHGGKSTGPKTAEGKARSLAAAQAGVAAYRERMRAAIEAGFIDRWWPPSDRTPFVVAYKALPEETKQSIAAARRAGFDRWAARIRAEIAAGTRDDWPAVAARKSKPPKKEQMMPRKAAPAPVIAAPPPVPIADDLAQRREMVEWQAKTRAEKLDRLTDEALDIVQWVFRLPPDAEVNPRILSAKKDAALSVLALEFKVGESVAERERKDRDRAIALADIARKIEAERV